MEQDLLFETKEHIYQEKLQKAIVRALPIVVFISVIIVIISTIIVLKNKSNLSNQYKMSEIYYKANEISKLGKSDAALESYNYLASNYNSGYASLATLKKANIMIDRKEYNLAFEIYENFAKDNRNDALLRYYAQYKCLLLMVNEQTNLKKDVNNLIEQLLDKKNPWRGAAMELKLIWLINNNQEKAALKMIELIEQDGDVASLYKERVDAIKSVKFGS